MQALFPAAVSSSVYRCDTKIAIELVNIVTQLKLLFNLQAMKTARWDQGGTIDHNSIYCTEAQLYFATKTLLLFKKNTAHSFPCNNSD